MELAKQLAHEQECTDGCNSIGNMAVHAVDKDALIRQLSSVLQFVADSYVPLGASTTIYQIKSALEAARKAGYP